jgi:hypothetical protein
MSQTNNICHIDCDDLATRVSGKANALHGRHPVPLRSIVVTIIFSNITRSLFDQIAIKLHGSILADILESP